MKIIATAVLLYIVAIFAMLIFGHHTGAMAHHWYSNQHNSKGRSCCSGNDCAAVPLDADWVQPTKAGYRVVLSVEQAQTINPNATFSMDVVVPYDEVLAPPPEAAKDSIPALYYLCIAAGAPNTVYCLFAAPSI